MTAKKSVGTRIIDGLTEFAEGLESGEPLENQLTGHKLAIDLTPRRYTAHDVRATRRLLRASQSLFARFVGVALGTVQAWEQGRNVPSGSAARLLDEIRLNPEFWKTRLASSLRQTSTKIATTSRHAQRPRAAAGESRHRTAVARSKKTGS
jgi:putative transcriptional regulator